MISTYIIIGILIYFISTGFRESFTFKYHVCGKECDKTSWLGKKDRHWKYHIVRIIEICAILFILKEYWGIKLIMYGVAGVCVYEMIFSWHTYGTPFYTKTSKWLGVPHPPGYIWPVLFIIMVTVPKLFNMKVGNKKAVIKK